MNRTQQRQQIAERRAEIVRLWTGKAPGLTISTRTADGPAFMQLAGHLRVSRTTLRNDLFALYREGKVTALVDWNGLSYCYHFTLAERDALLRALEG